MIQSSLKMEWYSRCPENGEQRSMRRRLRRLFLLLKKPSDILLLLRIGTWAIALPLLKRLVPLKDLTRWMWVNAKGPGTPEQQEKIASVVRWIYTFVFPGDGHCLERGLLLYRFLSRNKTDARLVTGLKRVEDQTFKGHAWILVDGEPFEEPEASVREFQSFMIFGPAGTILVCNAGGSPVTSYDQ